MSEKIKKDLELHGSRMVLQHIFETNKNIDDVTKHSQDYIKWLEEMVIGLNAEIERFKNEAKKTAAL